MNGDTAILLVSRRFLLPVLVAAVVTPFIGLFGAAILDGQMPRLTTNFSPRDLAVLVFYGGLFAAPAILLIGIPAGYAVAQGRAGIGLSLLLLVLIGAIAGWLIMSVMLGGPTPARALENFGAAALVGGLPGAVAAAIWTAFNLDLYRRQQPRWHG